MNALNAFDSKQTSQDGKDLFLMMPDFSDFFRDKEGNPWSIKLRGLDSGEYRAARLRMRRKMAEQSASGKEIKDTDLDGFVAEVMAACTISWSGISIDGETLVEFSEQAATDLYIAFPWILDAVSSFVESRPNFTPSVRAPLVEDSASQSGSVDSTPATAKRKKTA